LFPTTEREYHGWVDSVVGFSHMVKPSRPEPESR
jgi:hypothetical protein